MSVQVHRETQPPITSDLDPAVASQACAEAFVADFTTGIQHLRESVATARTQIDSIDPGEVSALRQASHVAGINAFAHLHLSDEGSRLQQALNEHLDTYSVPSITSVAVVQRITQLHPELVRYDVREQNSTQSPDHRLAMNLARARGLVMNVMLSIADLSDDEVVNTAAAIFDYPAAPHGYATELRGLLRSFLGATGSDLGIDLASIRGVVAGAARLQPVSFDPEKGWPEVEFPAGYTEALQAAEKRYDQTIQEERAARERVRLAAIARLAHLGIEAVGKGIGLSHDPMDQLAIIGAATQHGWTPAVTPKRYASPTGREFISNTPLAADAAWYLYQRELSAAA